MRACVRAVLLLYLTPPHRTNLSPSDPTTHHLTPSFTLFSGHTVMRPRYRGMPNR
ncbi:hypothetical protein BofuT4_P161710.1 [Botrytis cinerea T4]|uniref:Uncharacterized protein n=1 Tax=Botryotinia fuckeliana (strain T4) TaxID=999810 RepID=G2YTX2_BOTF4|nr:hypothetical protein BofuT4_P161710.1 [Botrytis cinerea T4]